jgi:hypothetical protein
MALEKYVCWTVSSPQRTERSARIQRVPSARDRHEKVLRMQALAGGAGRARVGRSRRHKCVVTALSLERLSPTALSNGSLT